MSSVPSTGETSSNGCSSSDVAEDIELSGAAFHQQFDPADPTHHGGDPTPVPLGGSRIPPGALEFQHPKESPNDCVDSGLPSNKAAAERFARRCSSASLGVENAMTNAGLAGAASHSPLGPMYGSVSLMRTKLLELKTKVNVHYI
eukprot:GHVT01103717.1.p2 GENE.GHVT01103717.1~~GHVT01103717.1.p2  ORF type:complete len:145 (+),score=17.38 GHVT01103717.1:182-616(+)